MYAGTMPLTSHYIAAYFAGLSAIFFLLSITRRSAVTRMAWQRIGIIFALVALVIFALRPR